MRERFEWDSAAEPELLAGHIPTGVVPWLVPSRIRRLLPLAELGTRAERARQLFDAMVARGIRYTHEPTDSRPGRQFVRPVEEVWAEPGAGTCLDLCVAYCSAALDAGLRPLLLVVRDGGARHAIVLVPLDWAWPAPSSGGEAVWREPFELEGFALAEEARRSPDAPGALLAVDVTRVARDGDWAEALAGGAGYLADWRWEVCLDVGALRLGLEPPRSVYEPPTESVLLEPGYSAAVGDRSALRLVEARTGVVPFVERAELDELLAWAEDARGGFGVRAVEGVGGSGKTRLAAELCARLAERGWYARFLSRDGLPGAWEGAAGVRGDAGLLRERELDWLGRVGCDLLLVVDYAEELSAERLLPVLRRLRGRGAATRVLLTARTVGQWLDELWRELAKASVVVRAGETLRLPPHPEPGAGLVGRAAAAFADRAGVPVPEVPPLPERVRWTALDQVLHGWLLVERDGAGELPETQGGLYDAVLGHELARWRAALAACDLATAEHELRRAAAVLSLVGPRESAEVAEVLAPLAGLGDEARRARLGEFFARQLCPPGGGPAVLRPDPVAERLIVRTFVDGVGGAGDPGELLGRVLPGDLEADPRIWADDCPAWLGRRVSQLAWRQEHVCEAATRCASQGEGPAGVLADALLARGPHLWRAALAVAGRQGGPLVGALGRATSAGRLPADELHDDIPAGHTYLRQLARLAAEVLLAQAGDDEARRAMALSNLGVRLGDCGDRVGALKVAEEAVESWRGLVERVPGAFEAELARALSNLGVLLGDCGDRVGALKVAEEAVESWRGLVERVPGAFEADLAAALNNLGVRLGDCGDRVGALKVAEEAVESWRGLVERVPGAFEADLAAALNNLGNRLAGCGDRVGALKAAEEAVAVYRGLVERVPGAFEADLAAALTNLGNRLGDCGDRVGALAAAREAVESWRGLVERVPGAFEADLAMALNNLGVRLAGCGDRVGALAAAEEAVAVYRGLVERVPGAFEADLAAALTNLGALLGDCGDRVGALKAAEEALQSWIRLATAGPAAFAPHLAKSARIWAELAAGADGDADTGAKLAGLLGRLPSGLQAVLCAEWAQTTPDQATALDGLRHAVALAETETDEKLRAEARDYCRQALSRLPGPPQEGSAEAPPPQHQP